MISKKTLKKVMIDRAGRKWNTKPERQFEEYQRSRGMGLIQNVKLNFAGFYFQLDFAHPSNQTFDIDYEIDGSHFHSSPIQAAKDHWKDILKNNQALKVIHIPAILTEKKWWSYLDEQLPKALLKDSPTVYINA